MTESAARVGRVLLFGRDGHLGSELVRSVPDGVALTALGRGDVDLRDADGIARAIADVLPDHVVNAAAFAQVDAAETERETARAVNALAPEAMGRACAARGARVLHFSTDYVFGGGPHDFHEDDAAAPLNWYGATKLEGERRLLAAHPAATIARVQWLFSARRPCFVKAMWERARGGLATRVVSDQAGRPTHVADVARATWSLLGAGATGVFHVTSTGPVVSRLEIARRVFAAAGAEALLSACTSADTAAAAVRPGRCALSTDRLRAAIGETPPDWRSRLDDVLDELARKARDAGEPPRAVSPG